MMKILVIALSGIGDTLMATPMIESLKELYPKSQLDVLVMWGGSKELLKNNPHISNLIQFNMIKEGFQKSLSFCRKLSKREYDISINIYPQSKTQYRVVSWIIGAKLRMSHKYSNWQLYDNLFINRYVTEDYSVNCSQNNIKLLNLLGQVNTLHSPKIYLSRTDLKKADDFEKSNKAKGEKFFGIHIGSGSTKNLPLRRWPIDNYISLIKLILKHKRVKILLFGGAEEESGNNMIVQSVKSNRVIQVKTQSISESAAIIGKSDFFLSVDTALMHIAAAMGIKNQIVIDTPTFNKTVYPNRKRFILIENDILNKDRLVYYKYDGKGIKLEKQDILRIMKNITPEIVYQRIQDLLK